MISFKEFLQEAEKKEVYTPKVGDDVRVPGDKVGQTVVGKVKKIGSMIHVELKDGAVEAYPTKHVFKMDMSCAAYGKWDGKA